MQPFAPATGLPWTNPISYLMFPFSRLLSPALLSFLALPAFAQWTQLGSDILGELPGEQSGFVTDLDAAGDRLAVGAPWCGLNGIRSGRVRVYGFDGTDWVQLGADLLGDGEEDEFGSTVRMSEDGNTLAIGAPERLVGPGPDSPPGYVRVFDWDGADWVQRGADLSAGVLADGFGAALDLSGTGDLVAIGAPYDASLASWAGKAYLWHWAGGAWEPVVDPVLATLSGTSTFSFTGGAIQLNHAGNLLAVGQEGESRVLMFEELGGVWTAKDTLFGTQSFGNALSLDATGQTIAIGGESLALSNGRVNVFQFNGTEYAPHGSPMVGTGDDLFLGWEPHALALQDDGSALVAGSLGNVVNGAVQGRVRRFQFQGGDWVQVDEFVGDGNTGQMGRSVSLNAAGTRLAVGTPYTGGEALDAGIVRVYAQENTAGTGALAPPSADARPHVFPNPARDHLHLRGLDPVLSYAVFSLDGHCVIGQTTANPHHPAHPIPISSLPAGAYLLRVTTASTSVALPFVRAEQ